MLNKAHKHSQKLLYSSLAKYFSNSGVNKEEPTALLFFNLAMAAEISPAENTSPEAKAVSIASYKICYPLVDNNAS